MSSSISINYPELGRRIRSHRLAVGLTQEALAERVDLVPSNISHIERAKTSVSLPTLVKIANVLHVSLDQLLCDSLQDATELLYEDMADILCDCTHSEVRALCKIAQAAKDALREV